jgi:hypothetical protein
MKKFSQRGLLLFGVMLAVSAFVVPSMASAASWFQVGTTHQLFSPNLAFTATLPVLGQAGWQCNGTEFDADVVTANTIEFTSGRFVDCMGTQGQSNCTVTATGTGFPWTATATATTNVEAHGGRITAVFENTPGNPNACQTAATITLTGTLTGGLWNPTTNELLLTDPQTHGLTEHVLGTGLNASAFVSGTFRDTTNTWRMFM